MFGLSGMIKEILEADLSAYTSPNDVDFADHIPHGG
jgi:hypothetical protein